MSLFLRLSLFAALCASLFAEEVLVAPADRDRLIRMQDGRQIRLPAGSELIRADDGKFRVRHRVSQSAAAPVDGSQRWVWFIEGLGAYRSVDRDWKVQTNNITFPDVIWKGRDKTQTLKIDGSSYNINESESIVSFGAAGGIKDTLNEHSYSVGLTTGDDINEIFLSGQFGFPSLKFFGSAVPFIRVTLVTGGEDGFFGGDALAYSLGAGASYPLSDAIELYAGLDYLKREWSENPAKAGGTTYGSEERSETEMRLFVGARYLLW
ncbi:MAG: hypothetical protein LBE89_03040 [Helicobacteraceae bacterium]|jgi:hypothetical protein|nr:hypothetical protein [Helicobacteraceae bacterium]